MPLVVALLGLRTGVVYALCEQLEPVLMCGLQSAYTCSFFGPESLDVVILYTKMWLVFSAMATATLPAWRNWTLPKHERALDLVGRMTREEKIPQLLVNTPAIPRLGIPASVLLQHV